MIEFKYFNDYDANKTNASDYEVCGQRIIEVWDGDDCLGVELDSAQIGFNGIPKVIFFINGVQLNLIRDSIPSNEELIEILHG